MLETLCSRAHPQWHLISQLYSSLFGEISAFSSSSSLAWEWDLGISLSDTDLESICSLVHRGSINVASQECCYRIYNQWYWTLVLLHKFYSTISDQCWHCEREKGATLHTWWSFHCKYVSIFKGWKVLRDIHYTGAFPILLFILCVVNANLTIEKQRLYKIE